MCDSPDMIRLTERDIAEITACVRELPGNWSVFPHVASDGEVTLLLTPARWEGEDLSILLQRDSCGIQVLLSEGDAVNLAGTAQEPSAAIEMVWRTAMRRAAPAWAG